MAASLPYKTEYAKSGRASCKGCKEKIDKGILRLAIMKPSHFHDGMDAHWHHTDCFFKKFRLNSVGDLEDFETLRVEDQDLIRKRMEANSKPGAGPKSPKGTVGPGAPPPEIFENFSVEYAKSSRSECVACQEKIAKDEVRIGKRDFTSEKALIYGGSEGFHQWHHVECFVKTREELEFFVAADKKTLNGFKDLDKKDQAMLKKTLKAIPVPKRKLEDGDANGGAPVKKLKLDKSEKAEEELIRKQNKLMYSFRDAIEDKDGGLKKPELHQVLRSNKQDVPSEPKEVLNLVADIMAFGAMERCPECKGQFLYKSGVGYRCTGYLNEFTRCNYVMEGDVKRKPFKVPNDLREHPIFEGKKFKVTERVIPKHAAPVVAKAMAAIAAGPSKKPPPKIVKNPLEGFKFAILGVKDKEKEKLAKTIKKFGGEMKDKCSASIAAVIMPPGSYDESDANFKKAKKYGLPVVSTDFVQNITDVHYKLVDELSKYLLSDWVKDIRGRLKTLNQEFEKVKEEAEKETPKSKKLILKDGAVIDPDSGMGEEHYHIYKEGNLYFNCVLNRTDLDAGTNSFYKMQIIESDQPPRSYHVFRSWGRIGTTSGGHQTDDMPTLDDAKELFYEKFLEKTGNEFGRKFVRKPGRYISVDIDYGQNKPAVKMEPSTESSKLPLAVQELVKLIFDVDTMKKTMLEFEIDLDKMPLGKISRKQILEAYSILTDSLNMRRDEKMDERKLNRMITDVSNRFYTLIPHNFGRKMPPLLDNDELLKAKIEMLDNLMEIEIAYELLMDDDKEGGALIDSHYRKLDADIDIVEAHSEEFKVIEKYLANTHAPTHSGYTLEIEQVYKVIRNGENERYAKYKDLHNRRLLWHGSRVSNFAGIISQGLRIAPPEAPVTGYMFGKGIYFADMVSKSANYCYTSPGNSTGLLLLSEVALGDMHELKQANDRLTKPPKDAHSVKGLGETQPDPSETYTFPDGVMVPYGKPKKTKIRDTALLYNEYIVYDVAQVNIKYLLKVKFNYGKRRK